MSEICWGSSGAFRELRRNAVSICAGKACQDDALEGQAFCGPCREKFLAENLRRFPPNQKGWVYFIQDTASDLIKIGFSKDVGRRFAALQQSCPTELVLLTAVPGTVKKERALHEYFAESRVRGEWFEESGDLCELIAMAVERERERDKKRLLLAAREAGIH